MRLHLSALLACPAAALLRSPDAYDAFFPTTQGTMLRMNFSRALAPLGSDHFFSLLCAGFYDDTGFVRIEEGPLGPFVVQWGIASDPQVSAQHAQAIADDPVLASNALYTVALAADGRRPNTRSTMLYVNTGANGFLDAQGFAPFGQLSDAASVAALQSLNKSWGESIYLPMVFSEGSAWLRSNFPGLTYTTVAGSPQCPAAALPQQAQPEQQRQPEQQQQQQQQRQQQIQHQHQPPQQQRQLNYSVSFLGNTYGGGPSQFFPRDSAWVQYSIDSLAVSPSTGGIFANSVWDEGTREAGIYSADGAIQGMCADLHGWARSGGKAIAVASSRVFVGMSQAPLDYVGPLRDAPVHDTWYGFRSYNLAGAPLPVPRGHGWDGSITVVCSNCSHVLGLAVSPSESVLYVAHPDPAQPSILLLDAQNFTQLGAWELPGSARAGKLAVDPATGNLWAAQAVNVTGLVWPYFAPGAAPQASVWCLTPAGELCAERVLDAGLPTALAIDAASNSLLVANNDRTQQVVVYALPQPQPRAAPPRTPPPAWGLTPTLLIGEAGGVLSGPAPGRVRPEAFSFLTGVGVVPASGDIVVASVGYTTNKLGSGTDLRRLTPSPSLRSAAAAHRAAGLGSSSSSSSSSAFAPLRSPSPAQVWNLLGLEWVDSAAVAPWAAGAAGAPEPADVLYTEHERFALAYSGSAGGAAAAAPGAGGGAPPPAAGPRAAYLGYTVDAARFSTSDARLHSASFATASVTVRALPARHLFLRGMYAQGPAWYRVENASSEVAVPCGLLSKDAGAPGAWPSAAPAGAPWAWQDDNGDGLMAPSEFVALTPAAGFPRSLAGVWGTSIAEDGSLWVASEDHWLLAWAARQDAATGCVRYDWRAPLVNLTQDLPPFVSVQRVLYLAQADALLVAGFTAALDNPNKTWGQCGRWVQRYEGFLARGAAGAGAGAGAGWALPWTNHSCSGVCSVDNAKAMDAAGELLAVVTSQSALVHVYNASTGAELGVMAVAAGGGALGNYTGWVDTPYGLTLSRAAGGQLQDTYLCAVEEDGRDKVLLYTFTVSGGA